MSQDNRKKPMVRSGDEIHPALATAIKIGGLVVIAALAVVLLFILIELFQKESEQKVIFEDNYHLIGSDFNILVDPNIEGGAFENISDKDISNLLISSETNEFYIFFYYSSLKDELSEEEVSAIESLEETFPLLIVDLDGSEFAEWVKMETWENNLMTHEDLSIILDKTKTNSFVLELNVEGRLEETFVPIFYGNGLLDFLNN